MIDRKLTGKRGTGGGHDAPDTSRLSPRSSLARTSSVRAADDPGLRLGQGTPPAGTTLPDQPSSRTEHVEGRVSHDVEVLS